MCQRTHKYTSTKKYVFDRLVHIFTSTLLIVTLSPHSTASAVQVTLGWGRPADGSVVNGYRVYSRVEGQSYKYTQPKWQGTTTTCTIPDVQAVTTHFVARAYNSYGESGNSNEVTYQPSTASANNPPAAVIDSITPNPATEGATVTFTGHGSDSDGSIRGWRWSSSLDGTLSSDDDSFSTSDLSAGTHTISFQAQDDDGAWSTPATRSLTVNGTSQGVREVIVDNRDANTARTGSWAASGGTSPFGADSVWARGGDDTFTWRFTPGQSGNYEVWEWHSGWSTRPSAAPHRITHAGGAITVSVNQKLNAGKWNSLGVYRFTAGVRYEVRVTSGADSSSTCADAVRWTLVP